MWPQASNTVQALGLVLWDVNAAQLPTMQVATWNVHFRDAAVLDYLAQVAVPDVVTLQEVTFKQEDAFRERLAGMGLKEVYYSGRLDAERIRYGNIIASRWPLDAVELRYPPKQLPWPQALAQVSVTVGGRSIVVITAHMPNGSTYGWQKIDTFLVLKDLVRRAKGRPCIVTGDFNEPQLEMQDGQVVTWGQEPTAEAALPLRRAGRIPAGAPAPVGSGTPRSDGYSKRAGSGTHTGKLTGTAQWMSPTCRGPEALDRPHVRV